MAQVIEHTPYAWAIWRDRVWLFRRFSLRYWWAFCLYVSVPMSVSPLLIQAVALSSPSEYSIWLGLLFGVGYVVVGAVISYGFYRLFKADHRVLIPTRAWRVGSGVQLSTESFKLPQATLMGGTLLGSPTKWLVVNSGTGKQTRLVQVYHDPELLKVNVALAIEKQSPDSI